MNKSNKLKITNPTILIDVSGGVVQEVFSDSPLIDVVLIDWDDIDVGGEGSQAIRRFKAVFDKDEMKKIIHGAKKKIKENQDFSLQS